MMELATIYCRICLESKQNNCSLHLHVHQKYLPNVIESICGVLITSFDEPDALVCKECAMSLVQADEIIQKCRESHRLLVEQRSLSLVAAVAAAAEEHSKYEREADVVVAEIGKQAQVEKKVAQTAEVQLPMCEVKEESHDDVPDLDGIEENLYVEPELFVESILESSRGTASGLTTPTSITTVTQSATTTIYQSTLKRTKPKMTVVRSREQYLKRKIRNYPVKEPLKLIGGAGVVRKRKPKTFHRAIPNFYFRCELCHVFESNVASYAVTHLSAVHGIDRPAIFRCPQCDTKPFIKNQSLQEHIATIHRRQPKSRDFVCATCEKTFIKNCHLQKHLLSVHKQMKQVKNEMSCERPTLSCPQCGYKFLQRTRYDAHIKRARCKSPEDVVVAGLAKSATAV